MWWKKRLLLLLSCFLNNFNKKYFFMFKMFEEREEIGIFGLLFIQLGNEYIQFIINCDYLNNQLNIIEVKFGFKIKLCF